MVETGGEVIKLTEDGGVTKKILVEGDEDGETPQEGQEVLVNYEGRLTDGSIFDSSYDKEALKGAIGVGQVIKGWDIGIMSMKLGEKAEPTETRIADLVKDHKAGGRVIWMRATERSLRLGYFLRGPRSFLRHIRECWFLRATATGPDGRVCDRFGQTIRTFPSW